MSKHLNELIDETVNETSASAEVADYLLLTEEDMMQCEHSWHVDEDDIDYDDEETRADYEKFVHGRAQERVEAAINELSWLKEVDGRINVWRSITVRPDWIQNGITDQPIGLCWSHAEDAAEAHFGNFSEDHRLVVLHGMVSIEDVDWQTSVITNAQAEEEREIRLKGDAIVEVLSGTWAPETRGGKFVKEAIGVSLPAGMEAFAMTGQVLELV
jgi:hypothetical protein